MKTLYLLFTTLLLTNCNLLLPNHSNSNIVYHETFEAYYDSNFTQEVLMFKTNSGPAYLSDSINPKTYGIYNIIEGDKITIYSSSEIYIQEKYPAIISSNNVTNITIEKVPVYEFEVLVNDNNEFYLLCLDNDSTYTLNNENIYYSNFPLLSTTLDLYKNMKLYGSMIDNKIHHLYKYNPRIQQYNHYKNINNEVFLFLENDNNKGVFINSDFLITIDIIDYPNLTKGNEYTIYTKLEESLITNLKEMQYLTKATNIKLNKENIHNSSIDIGLVYIQDNYDCMPRYDDFNDGTVTFPHIYMNTSFYTKYYHLENASSYNEIIKEDIYMFNNNSRVFNNYTGLNFIKDDNKEKYLVNKDELILKDSLLFIEDSIEINYM